MTGSTGADLVIAGGTVIDPAQELHEARDVGHRRRQDRSPNAGPVRCQARRACWMLAACW